jgi:hypothetical protein
MRNEMDLMNMDERQRLAWFMANRGTVIAVGAVWIAMIGWELTHARMPAFLMIMVPVFALFRAGLYRFYSSRPLARVESKRDPAFVRYGKAAAVLMLLVAACLPLFSFDGASQEASRTTYSWGLVRDDPLSLIPLAIVYLWPLFVFILARIKSQRMLQVVLQYMEPALAVASSIIVLWIPRLIFETKVLFSFIIVPVGPSPEWGCYLAVVANGLYTVSWLAGLLRPWGIQED